MELDFSNYKFHCSTLGLLMTEARNKNDKLSATTIKELKEVHSEVLFGYRKSVDNIYTMKGNLNEDDSIRLLSKIHERPYDSLYTKNEKTFENDFVVGTPDIYIEDAFVGDVKSSFTRKTFPMYEEFGDLKRHNKNYYWQMQGYMWLTGLDKSILAYCLVDSDPEVIEYDRYRKAKELNVLDLPKDVEDEIQHFHNPSKYMREEHRVVQFPVALNKNDIEKLKERVSDCRDYLNYLSDYLTNKVKLK